jgi:hypothetical protein
MHQGDLGDSRAAALGYGGVALIALAAATTAQRAERDEGDVFRGRTRSQGDLGCIGGVEEVLDGGNGRDALRLGQVRLVDVGQAQVADQPLGAQRR